MTQKADRPEEAPPLSAPLPSISDEDLHGFVDGELDPARKKAMLAHLQDCPADAARAEAWRRQNEALRAAFADVLTEPASPSLLPCAMSAFADIGPSASGPGSSKAPGGRFRSGGLTTVGLGLAFAAGVATALAAGMIAERLDARKQPRLGTESRVPIARNDDVPFVDRTLQAVVPYEPGLADNGSAKRPFAELLIVPNLSDAGLTLTGIRTSPGSPSAAPCLLYRTGTDIEVTLCIDKARGETEPRAPKPNDPTRPALSWRQKGARYTLAGGLAEAELGLLADRARAEIEKFAAR